MSDKFHTREQRYAAAVFDQVKTFHDERSKVNPSAKQDPKSDPEIKKYGSLAHKLPVLIRTGGLAQALSFIQARNKEGTSQRRLLQDFEAVLKDKKIQVLASDKRLAEQSREADFEEYMRLTEASLEALLWFKRFAESELQIDSGNADQEADHATT